MDNFTDIYLDLERQEGLENEPFIQIRKIWREEEEDKS